MASNDRGRWHQSLLIGSRERWRRRKEGLRMASFQLVRGYATSFFVFGFYPLLPPLSGSLHPRLAINIYTV